VSASDSKKLISDRKIRFALVGFGRIAMNHLNALKLHSDDCKLVDVCDIDPLARDRARVNTEAKVHPSLDAMLEVTTADCVILTTPSGLHASQAIQIAMNGKHIVTEKPMATRWEDGLRMVEVADEAGVKLFVVKQNRLNRTLQLLKSAIDENRFGRIYSVAINVFWTRPQEYYDSAQWRGTWEYDGGAFMNQASHYVDLLDWLVGPVESVSAFTATLGRNIEVEDSGVAALCWRSGTLGTVNVTMLTYPKNFEGSITILGERGTVRVGGVAVNEILHWEFDEVHAQDADVKNASYETASVYGNGHEHYYRNVIASLYGKADPETDGREGLKSLELLIAMYRSAQEGRQVALPLEH